MGSSLFNPELLLLSKVVVIVAVAVAAPTGLAVRDRIRREEEFRLCLGTCNLLVRSLRQHSLRNRCYDGGIELARKLYDAVAEVSKENRRTRGNYAKNNKPI